MLKADDYVKEKALIKLKEIKGKPDDMGAKAKQYLEGLVKIPFGVYKEETILKHAKENNKSFINILEIILSIFPELSIEKKKKYTPLETLSLINFLLLSCSSIKNSFFFKFTSLNRAKKKNTFFINFLL
jgi:hypothetical protein